MSEVTGDLGDQGTSREPVTPMRVDQLRDEIDAMLAVELSLGQRVSCVAGGTLSISVAVAFGLLARRRWDGLPPIGNIIVAAGPLTLLLLGVFMIGVGRRGVYDRRYHGWQFLALALVLCFGLSTAFLFAGWRSGDGQLVFGGTVMLVIGGAGFVLHLLEQNHLTTQHKLLELELRMAELADAVRHPRRGES